MTHVTNELEKQILDSVSAASDEAALEAVRIATLGKSGSVSARFPRGTRPPVALLCEWIDESYRAIAPKTLLKRLPA